MLGPRTLAPPHARGGKRKNIIGQGFSSESNAKREKRKTQNTVSGTAHRIGGLMLASSLASSVGVSNCLSLNGLAIGRHSPLGLF